MTQAQGRPGPVVTARPLRCVVCSIEIEMIMGGQNTGFAIGSKKSYKLFQQLWILATKKIKLAMDFYELYPVFDHECSIIRLQNTIHLLS